MKPRANALGLLFKGGSLLLEEQTGRHSRGAGVFYRPLGGTIESGESPSAAVVREFQEEIGATVTVLRPSAIVENCYSIDGKKYHETTQLLVVAFTDELVYRHEWFPVTEGKKKTVAKWMPITDLQKPETVLFPNSLLQVIEEEVQKGGFAEWKS
ncbi:NUDIX hydrolase [Planococcus sp. YIM B11945]|uniref:NUDIX hydrolase n=1 Tax=Planococcus sp. YIM B11945 TaxID=3435410 RepID=UPI003D7E35C4